MRIACVPYALQELDMNVNSSISCKKRKKKKNVQRCNIYENDWTDSCAFVRLHTTRTQGLPDCVHYSASEALAASSLPLSRGFSVNERTERHSFRLVSRDELTFLRPNTRTGALCERNFAKTVYRAV